MSISRWQDRQGQTYNDIICTIDEMWRDFEPSLKGKPEHEVKQCKDAFYSALNCVCFELSHFGFDPEAVGLALGMWSKEFGMRLGAQMDRDEMLEPLNSQLSDKPSTN